MQNLSAKSESALRMAKGQTAAHSRTLPKLGKIQLQMGRSKNNYRFPLIQDWKMHSSKLTAQELLKIGVTKSNVWWAKFLNKITILKIPKSWLGLRQSFSEVMWNCRIWHVQNVPSSHDVQACLLKFKLRDFTLCLCFAAAWAVCFEGSVTGVNATDTRNEVSQPTIEFTPLMM